MLGRQYAGAAGDEDVEHGDGGNAEPDPEIRSALLGRRPRPYPFLRVHGLEESTAGRASLRRYAQLLFEPDLLGDVVGVWLPPDRDLATRYLST
ncbi:hypothetical protein Adu01nite_29430 [Paractinoplanes durhamensis]|uniref:Uncharacterized protein n=1 Tax=Paractinoplanes durhamensis TaxID=113563 RepID=A0ABQ3YVI2_9ACTN|nr:hypothetical protein Adu01nite_29430 [Actinoplanes durhamensis]